MKTRGRPKGSRRRRFELTYRSTGDVVVYDTLAEAGAALGVSGDTLRVYLTGGHGECSKRVWSDKVGDYDIVTIRRIGVDPLSLVRI